MTGPRDGYDDAVAAIRGHAGDLGTTLAIWSARNGTKPDTHARRAASGAVDAIDAALAGLHAIRARLTTEIRASDDATAIRADKLLAGRADAAMTPSSDQASPGPAGLGKPKGRARCERPGPAKGNADEQE